MLRTGIGKFWATGIIAAFGSDSIQVGGSGTYVGVAKITVRVVVSSSTSSNAKDDGAAGATDAFVTTGATHSNPS